MFKKILIANRGEIACRVMRTAKRMGIKTVAVHSDADAMALHVREADEAVAIGGSAAAESYLKIERIVEACKQTGAEAVHPGYGFLSENRAFAAALEEAGIAFIGPGTHAIAAMGDKIESKKLAKAAGVSTVPGYMGVIADGDEAVKIAREIGYPVMIKASAGGGGKGMRLAKNDAEAKEGFRSATNEARSSFGDDRVFIEKYIEEPRHIEIQVLGDAHGNVIYLGERECSIQRRHQKVIEEAPSPFLDAATRAAMGAQAVALAKAVEYKSAGTVEFIVDRDRNFYFLEMNTRLQVEHPVTEEVTGLDLVELMIRVAYGEKLPITQADVKLKGHAIEARVYAEDPLRGFVPSIGRLTRYRPPEGQGVRVDTGVYEGAEITMFYDPMIAKLVTYGADRKDATHRMAQALDAFAIRGVNHNIGFLAAIMGRERFTSGRLSTDFIATEFPDGFQGAALSRDEADQLVSIAAVAQHRITTRDLGAASGPHKPAVPADWTVLVGPPPRARREVHVVPGADGTYAVTLDGHTRQILTQWAPGVGLFEAKIDGVGITLQIDRAGAVLTLFRSGAATEMRVVSHAVGALTGLMPVKTPPDLSKFLLSPMPGLLVSVAVAEGQDVKAGEELAVVEAMKMENVLRAERDGKVKKIAASPRESLAVDQVIIEFE
ncbi:acetyl/propionyl-CoA carboxylase subuit alpha [Aliidongia dinghuensis]|uniref:propionyl-CoA carboxylase n=1 Tax=Aliidongia dinghuensis TaxID=1867774 RepID=A0A8J2YXP2_9PROT|nr:acetyl/propionyl/methylcrotonyl-CoA carboxylase subunit alpha [Aliidongia dinghuensis]GGF29451.1 acetyl/propionyl-CoA carboxylase subuit alpha [Aliidongia dinghuensis]